jgi:hypothetical protein
LPLRARFANGAQKLADRQYAVRADQSERLHSERKKGDEVGQPNQAHEHGDSNKPSKFWHLQREFRVGLTRNRSAAHRPISPIPPGKSPFNGSVFSFNRLTGKLTSKLT